MNTIKHPKAKSPFPNDLDRNPGIGQSRGSFATGEDPDELEGVNTSEGDVENEVTRHGGVQEEGKLGRTNK